MDAATKPPWTGLRRPRKPTVPCHPTECPLLLLRRLLPWLEAGAGLQALPTPHYGRVDRCRAAAWRRRRFDYT
ncbi:hypothetical protein EGJ03_07290 [Stenotrophomonas maltophilia]|nr:hypothetical protein EGJ06_17525 [Stenotrophomonas maltophilia]RRU09804.1 hypothetical protein EGJ77_14930 [Stenotrophomonas maltophilia]RRU33448.1 hypothetical protein EGJ03_07290 [Stenotrophomonas maltophilia]RRU82391.1 hypothetical protein EGI98_15735 [Stenotrophomonas maltophilia]RRU91945.1 hypothetical protein EGI91_15095 [Stenotrophomonas maltophilia]